MRMWSVDPTKMCRQHLLGEHLEMHMFVGAIKSGISIEGYITNGLVNPRAIKERHDQLAEEMVRRGYRHQSSLEFDCSKLRKVRVNVENSIKELRHRCKECTV